MYSSNPKVDVNAKLDTQSFQDVAKLASDQENTKELQNFWFQKYTDLLTSGRFILSNKTEELLSSHLPIERPATPYGDLVLVKFLKPNNSLDEAVFQSVIEIAVRFLDSLIEAIDFVPSARFVVGQYRKIGLGLIDFDQYLNRRRTSEIQEIDYIGDLLSNNAYRASEALAEEKGACANWMQINKHIRPKLFELWKNQKTKAISTSLEIAEEVGAGTSIDQDWSIIPRRNSALLLLPKNLEWQIWSDRDQTAPKTEFTPLNNQAPQPDLSNFSIFDTNTEIQTEPIPEVNQNVQIDVQGTETITETSLEQIANINTNQAKSRLDKSQNNQNIFENKPSNWLDKPQDVENPFETIYQIGELVKIRKPECPEFGKVYQIIEAVGNKEGKGLLYRLTNGDLESERKLWQDKEFIPVDLLDVLEKMNDFEKVQSELNLAKKYLNNPVVTLHAIILDLDKNHFLAIENGDSTNLPSVVWNTKGDIFSALQDFLLNEYGLTCKKLEIIGLSQEYNNKTAYYALHIGVYIDANFTEPNNKIFWHSFNEVDLLPDYSVELLQKYLINEDSIDVKNTGSDAIIQLDEAGNNADDNFELDTEITTESSADTNLENDLQNIDADQQAENSFTEQILPSAKDSQSIQEQNLDQVSNFENQESIDASGFGNLANQTKAYDQGLNQKLTDEEDAQIMNVNDVLPEVEQLDAMADNIQAKLNQNLPTLTESESTHQLLNIKNLEKNNTIIDGQPLANLQGTKIEEKPSFDNLTSDLPSKMDYTINGGQKIEVGNTPPLIEVKKEVLVGDKALAYKNEVKKENVPVIKPQINSSSALLSILKKHQ